MSENKASRVLTRRTVSDGNPCENYYKRFTERFPISVEVTVDLAVAQAADWDWYWAAGMLLTSKGHNEFIESVDALEEAYAETMQPYWALHEAAYNEYYSQYRLEMARLLGDHPGMSWDERFRKCAAQFKHLYAAQEAARNAADKVANKVRQEGIAKVWAEIYISEA